MSETRLEDVPAWLLELVKDHEPLVENGYTYCDCGWNDYGNEEYEYNEHFLRLVLPELAQSFVAKASKDWVSTDNSNTGFGLGRVRRYTVGDIKKELLERLEDGRFTF